MNYLTLEKVLNQLKMEELLDSPFKDQLKILKWDVEEDIFSHNFKRGYSWYIIEGSIITTRYYSGGKELLWELNKGTWLNTSAAILNLVPKGDMKILKGTVVLEIPLYEMLLSETLPASFYKKMLLGFAATINPLINNVTTRMSYGDEMYFLKYLESNDYKIEFTSLKDLAEVLNINLRTFHRILKRLVEKNLILKEVNHISVIDLKAYNKYIEDISSI